MKILSITAQKPDSTGSGVFLTELVMGFWDLGSGWRRLWSRHSCSRCRIFGRLDI